MSNPQESIPESTLDLLASSFYRQSSDYGFQQVDYVRFVNKILDRAMGHQKTFPFQETRQTANGPQRDKSLHSPSLPVVGERIKIRAIDRKADRALFEEWLADAYGRNFLLSLSTAQTPTINQFLSNEYNIIGVILSQEDKPIGSVAYLNYDVNQCKAELRKLIGVPEMRGKGLGKEATALWIQYGIDALDLHKIYLNTLNTNLRNIKLNEELGFHVEGILRNEVFVDGKYHDVLRMGLSFES